MTDKMEILPDSVKAILDDPPDPLQEIFPPGSLGAGLVANPRRFSFFQAVRILQSAVPDAYHVGGVASASAERLRFRAFDGLGFPSSDIDRLQLVVEHPSQGGLPDEITSHPRLALIATFMGLQGSQSPLPTWMGEEILQQDSDDNPRRDFLDFFHHRLFSFLPRIWEKYRYWASYREGAADPFSGRIFAFIGLIDQEIRANSSDLNWERLLAYIGLLAGRNRSSDVVRGVIAHSFDLSDRVAVEEFVLRNVRISEEQRNVLGKKNSDLGINLHLGGRIPDRNGKFRLWLGPLGFSRFFRFLPTEGDFDTLCRLVAFMLRDQLAYDLCLILKRPEVPSFRLNDPHCLFGWSTWLGAPPLEDQTVILTARQ